MLKKSADGSAVTVAKTLHKVTPEQKELESKVTALTTLIASLGSRVVEIRTRLAMSNTSQILLNDLDGLLGLVLNVRTLVDKQIELDQNPPPQTNPEQADA